MLQTLYNYSEKYVCKCMLKSTSKKKKKKKKERKKKKKKKETNTHKKVNVGLHSVAYHISFVLATAIA